MITNLRRMWLLIALTLTAGHTLAQCVANAGSDVTICAGQSVTLGGNPTASGGSGGYSYDWTGLSGSDDVANPTIIPSATTTYTVTVTDGTGCSTTDSVVITVTPLPTVNGGPDKERCLNGPVLNLPAVGTWSGAPMVTPAGAFTPNTVGTFNLIVTATANGCSNTDQVSVVVHPLPTADAGLDQTVCPGTTVQLNATATSPNGAITLYTWSGGAVSNSLIPNPTATPASTTTYNVTAVDVEGCADPDQVTIFVLSPPAVNAGNDISICTTNGPIQLSGFSPAGGNWTGTGVSAGGLFTPTVAGSFTLTYNYTSPLGCLGSDQMVVNVISPSSIDAGPNVSMCLNSPAQQLVPVTPGGTWSGSSQVTAGGLFTPSSSGTANLTYTVNLGSCNASDQITVTVHTLPVANAGSDASVCSGSTAQLNGSASGGLAPYSSVWNNAATLSNNTILNPVASPTATTNYTLTITDGNNCSASDAVLLTVNSLPVVNAGADQSVCSTSGAITLTGFSPAGGTWSGAGVTTAGVFTPGVAGPVTLTYSYTNAQGCSATDQKIMTVVAPTPVNAGPDVSLCLNSASQQLTPVTSGGSWSGSGQVTSGGLFTPSTSGGITLTYTVNQGTCNATDQVLVTVYTLPVVNAGSDVAICSGASTTLNGSASGGQSPYSPVWNNAGSLSNNSVLTPVATPNSTTTYTLTVTDNHNCTASDAVIVTVNSLPVVNAGNDISLCTTAGATSLGGFSPSGGTWSGPGVTSGGIFTPGPAGITTLTYSYTNAQSCTSSDQVLVTVVAPAPVNGGADVSLCLSAPAQQLVPVTSGGTWSGSPMVTSGGLFTPSSSGSSTLTYTVNQGTCIASDQVIVTVHTLPVANAGNDVSICSGSTSQLNGSALGGLAPYSPVWNNGGTLSSTTILNPVASPLATTTYTLTITDSHNCSASDAVVVTVNSLPVVNAGNDITLCTTSGATTLSGYSPAGGQWSGPGVTTAGVFTPSTAGAITLTYTYTNALGCIGTDQLVATVVAAGAIDAGPDVGICLNAPAQQLVPNSPGGSWSGSPQVTAGGMFTPTISGSTTLTYTVNQGTCNATDQVVVTVHTLPVVNAGLDASICSGNSTQLNGSASGGLAPYSPVWNNSSTLSNSTVLNPTATPLATTTYTLTVTDGHGCSSSDAAIVNVNALPVVSAGNDIVLCDQPMVTVLSGGTPTGGTWSGTGVTPAGNFTPSGTGTYVLTYTFTNANGCSGSDQLDVLVNAAPVISAGNDLEMCANSPVEDLSANTGDAGFWSGTGVVDVSNGLFDPTVAGPGNHTVTLSSGTGSCMVTDQLVITVDALPAIDAGNDQVFCSNEPVTGVSTFSPAGGTWSGTGIVNTSTGTFDPAIGVGNYTLTYSYTDGVTGCTNQDQKTVEVASIPQAIFTLPSQGCNGVPIVPDNSSIGATSYTWDVTGNPSVSGTEPGLIFSNDGVITVKLTAYNAQSCHDEEWETIEIISAPVASFTTDVDEGCAPLNVDFTNLSTGQYLTFSWDLSTSTSTDFEPPVQTYLEDVGETNYDVHLTVSNACGTDEDDTTLLVHPRPVAEFSTVLIGSECSPVTVEFMNSSSGNPDACFWNFGDGTNSMMNDPADVVYFTEGTASSYTIWLYVENECGIDSAMQMVTVLPNLVTASFAMSSSVGCSPFSIAMDDQSVGATDVEYNFSNLFTSSDPNADFTYVNPGTYTISMYATDGCGFDTTEAEIEVLASPTADFTVSDSDVCSGTDVTLNAIVTGADDVVWNLGDGSSETDFNIVHSYVNENNYTITLTAVATNLCEAEATQQVQVWSNPVAQFALPQSEVCSGNEICVENQSTNANQYDWVLGDGDVSSGTNPCHLYTNNSSQPVQLTISLVAENIHGCTDNSSMDITVNNLPVSDFELDELSSCTFPVTVDTDVLDESEMSYEWVVNSQPVSGAVQPPLTFDAVGSYTVQLTVTNNLGCESSSEEQFTVHPEPVSAFSTPNQTGCIDFHVPFMNSSIGASSYLWDFGDGNTSTAFQPTNIYDAEGTYSVSLITWTSFGCSDTLVVTDFIESHGLPEANFDMSLQETSIYLPEITFSSTSEGAELIDWDFDDGQYMQGDTVIHEFLQPGVFEVTLTATNFYGCTDEMTRTVTITTDLLAFIPNTFTPNGDGINDMLIPEIAGKDFIRFYQFRVFDRWGGVVFETYDPYEGWIGDIKKGGYFAPDGVYTYDLIVKPFQSADVRRYSGNVTLMR